MSIALDTNCYVSGLNYFGPPYRILEMARAGAICIDISDAIEKELFRVLRENFGWDG